MRVVLHFIIIAKHSPFTLLITFEDINQAAGNFVTYLFQCKELSRCGGIFYFKIITIIKMILA